MKKTHRGGKGKKGGREGKGGKEREKEGGREKKKKSVKGKKWRENETVSFPDTCTLCITVLLGRNESHWEKIEVCPPDTVNLCHTPVNRPSENTPWVSKMVECLKFYLLTVLLSSFELVHPSTFCIATPILHDKQTKPNHDTVLYMVSYVICKFGTFLSDSGHTC